MNAARIVNIGLTPDVARDLKKLKIAVGYSTGSLPTLSEVVRDAIKAYLSANPALSSTFDAIG